MRPHAPSALLLLLLVLVGVTAARDPTVQLRTGGVREEHIEFALLFLEWDMRYLCQVPQFSAPLLAFPDLGTLLSDHRPTYECATQDNLETKEYRLRHFKGCWRLEHIESESVITCLQTWAPSPLFFHTASPKLDEIVRVETCIGEENERSIGAFHVTDLDRIQRGVTSFFPKIAHNWVLRQDVYYGVSSRYFAFQKDNTWHFTANWKNVGTADYSHLKCTDEDGKMDCSRYNATVKGRREPAHAVFHFDTMYENAHTVLIKSRNSYRKPQRYEFALANQLSVPLVGFGTGMLEPVRESLEYAKELGYGLIDTAAIYGNEREVGEVFTGPNRTALIETKVWPTELGYERTVRSIMKSREQLGMQILDIVVLHWPRCYSEWKADWMDCSTADQDDDGELWLDSWRALERLYAEGFILAIGVSNFDLALLDVALAQTKAVDPMIVQNQFSIDHPDRDVMDWCKSQGVLYQGYSLFRHGFTLEDIANIEDAMIEEKWQDKEDIRGFLMQAAINENIGFLCRASQKKHLQENLEKANSEITVKRSILDLITIPVRS